MKKRFPDNALLGPRDEFIIANLGLVHDAARNYRMNGAYHDIISEGTIGLITAYDRFNKAELEFSTYAVPFIRGYISNYHRKQSGSFSAPTRTVMNARKCVAIGIQDESAEVIADKLKISPKYANDVAEYLAVRNTTVISEGALDAKGYDDTTGNEVEAFIADQNEGQQRILRALMAGYSQSEVSRMLGVSRQWVSQAIKIMRKNYEKRELIGA